MLKKLADYETYLRGLVAEGRPLSADRLQSVATRIAFFQHERLAHELVMILFALLSVGGVFFFVAFPEIPIFCLDVLFFALLIPYIKHYYGLENGVQRLQDLYAELDNL